MFFDRSLLLLLHLVEVKCRDEKSNSVQNKTGLSCSKRKEGRMLSKVVYLAVVLFVKTLSMQMLLGYKISGYSKK